MDQFARVYEIVWSVVAIGIGGFGFFYTDKFISGNTRAFEKLHKKTGLSLFKKQSEGMKAPYMRLFTKALGALFFVIGILMLSGYIFIQQSGQGSLDSELSVNESSQISDATTSSACANFPKSLDASGSNPLILQIPAADFIRTHVDSSSVANVKTLYFAQTSPGCEAISLSFSTIAPTGTAEVSVLRGDNAKANNVIEMAKIQVVITNQYDPHKFPELQNVNAQALSSLDTYLKIFWVPILVEKGDFNGDGRDDYLVALQAQSVEPDNNNQTGEGTKNRKLLILGSNGDGNYSILLDSDSILISGQGGGASHPDGPDFYFGSTGIHGNEVEIVQTWGTSWRGNNVNFFRYDATSKTLKRDKDISDYSWLNGSWNRTLDYTETDYDNQGKPISTRIFNDLDGIDPKKDYKAVQLQNFAAFPDFFTSTTYSGGTYYLVPYFHTHENAQDIGIDPNESEGAFILHDGKVVWQTGMWLEYIDSEQSRFEDANGDGAPEIIIVEANPADEKLCNYYIYAWNNGSPKPLSADDVSAWANKQKEIKDGTCKITLGR